MSSSDYPSVSYQGSSAKKISICSPNFYAQLRPKFSIEKRNNPRPFPWLKSKDVECVKLPHLRKLPTFYSISVCCWLHPTFAFYGSTFFMRGGGAGGHLKRCMRDRDPQVPRKPGKAGGEPSVHSSHINCLCRTSRLQFRLNSPLLFPKQ